MPRFAIVEEKTIEGPEGSAQDPKNVQAGEAVDQTHCVTFLGDHFYTDSGEK